MNPFAAIAVKTIGAGTAAALISLGIAGGLAQAASPNPTPSSTAAGPTKSDTHKDRRAIRLAIIESEADVLHLTPVQLREDLRQGKRVADLAKDRGMSKDQFAAALATDLKPRLEALVEHKVITQAQADKVLDRISKATFRSGTASTRTRRRPPHHPPSNLAISSKTEDLRHSEGPLHF